MSRYPHRVTWRTIAIGALADFVVLSLIVLAMIAFVRWFELPPLQHQALAIGATSAGYAPQGVFVCTEHVGPRRPRPLIHYREIS